VIISKGDAVWSRGRTDRGTATGGSRRCQLEGCNGICVGVKWANGKMTWPCTRGMAQLEGEWEII
jgi:uncharacterized membrane protein